MAALRWWALGVVLAVPLWYVTYAVSAGRSCGAYDSGPDTAAQEAFCGGMDAGGYTLQFHLVQLIPVAIVLVGAKLAADRESPARFVIAAVLGLLSTGAIWLLIP